MMISVSGRSTSTLPRGPATILRSMEAEDASAAAAAGKSLYEVFVALKERER